MTPTSQVVTRFAPSPTGELHLGNARTALFSLLYARRSGGRFILRIEDTDTERSREAHSEGLMRDLRWLGLDWDEGPDVGGPSGPYRQSERGARYARRFAELEAQDLLYPCFCSVLELELSRRAQLAAGRPPRYAGTCRELSAGERAARRAAGAEPALRFRVPQGRRLEFEDFVHGPQQFATDDLGDFIVRRADGGAAFFFCNAVDDAEMGVTHVLRGEDHLANTPRQRLLIEALGLRAPAYGHVSLLVGEDGAPLSKRHGATTVRELRERGYLPGAVLNLLFRLGHSTSAHGVLSLAAMAEAFDPRHLGRSPARFDPQQLHAWQKEVVHQLPPAEAEAWLEHTLTAPALPPATAAEARRAFLQAVLPNVVLPEDAGRWSGVLYGDPPVLPEADVAVVRAAGVAFFEAAARAAAASPDLKSIAGAARAASGRQGPELFLPLRLALTGLHHGPELAPLLRAMTPGKIEERLARFAR
jgi:glutamyl-tRNA synthetase